MMEKELLFKDLMNKIEELANTNIKLLEEKKRLLEKLDRYIRGI